MSQIKSSFVSGGYCLLSLVVGIVGVVVVLFLIEKGIFLIAKIYNTVDIISSFIFGICLVILLPLLIFKKTRELSATSLYLSSYFFGFHLWLFSFVVTYTYWGKVGVTVGLAIAGIGLFPLAIIASVLNAGWIQLLSLAFMSIITFGSRFLALHVSSKQA